MRLKILDEYDIYSEDKFSTYNNITILDEGLWQRFKDAVHKTYHGSFFNPIVATIACIQVNKEYRQIVLDFLRDHNFSNNQMILNLIGIPAVTYVIVKLIEFIIRFVIGDKKSVPALPKETNDIKSTANTLLKNTYRDIIQIEPEMDEMMALKDELMSKDPQTLTPQEQDILNKIKSGWFDKNKVELTKAKKYIEDRIDKNNLEVQQEVLSAIWDFVTGKPLFVQDTAQEKYKQLAHLDPRNTGTAVKAVALKLIGGSELYQNIIGSFCDNVPIVGPILGIFLKNPTAVYLIGKLIEYVIGRFASKRRAKNQYALLQKNPNNKKYADIKGFTEKDLYIKNMYDYYGGEYGSSFNDRVKFVNDTYFGDSTSNTKHKQKKKK